MKELIDYKNGLKENNLEQLLNELEKQTKDKEYHRLISRNDKLEKLAQDKILIIKMLIFDNYNK